MFNLTTVVEKGVFGADPLDRDGLDTARVIEEFVLGVDLRPGIISGPPVDITRIRRLKCDKSYGDLFGARAVVFYALISSPF